MATDTRERLLTAAHLRVMSHGFNATTVDDLLADVGVSKGSFFHHFPSKAELGRALVERYARADLEVLDQAMTVAEAVTEDPAGQVVEFLRYFEKLADAGQDPQPGCLFISFVFEAIPDLEDVRPLITRSVHAWRDRVLEKLEAAARLRPPVVEVDLVSLADQVFTVFEGAFVLVRASGEPGALAAQLGHLRRYVALLFDVRK